MLDISAIPHGAPLRIIIGAGNQSWPGWIATQREQLDLSCRDDWADSFGDRRIDALLCEHVWEHLTEDEGRAAAKLCYEFLKPGGYLRCAVPDANFPDEDYQRTVRIGGPGPADHPAADHKVVYDYRLFTDIFTSAGFEVELLEYCDGRGRFHFTYWDPADGPIYRSLRSDHRNQDGKLRMASLIVDARKPLQYTRRRYYSCGSGDKQSLQKWETLVRREIADRRPWLHLWAEDVRLPDGRVIEGFSTIEMPDYVVVVALTPDDKVIVEHSYKHGPRRVGINLPAGYIEPDEDPMLAAQRELREETGYVADQWRSLGRFTNDGNQGCGKAYLFLARNAHQVVEPDGNDLEEIVIDLMDLDELSQAVRRDDVAVLSTAAAMGLAIAALSPEERR